MKISKKRKKGRNCMKMIFPSETWIKEPDEKEWKQEKTPRRLIIEFLPPKKKL
jgi:hypothetical protein